MQGRRPVRGRRLLAGQPAHRTDVHRRRRHADRDRRRRSASSPTRPSAGSTASPAPTSTARTTHAELLGLLRAGHLEGRRSPDHQRRAPLRAADAGRHLRDADDARRRDARASSALKNNWAPRIGVVYDVLGNGRRKLYGNYGRFYARIPNDLAARALSGDAGISRGDYFDANLTQPIPNGVLRRAAHDHLALRGRRPAAPTRSIPTPSCPTRTSSSPGFEYEAMPEHQPRRPLHPPQHRPRARGHRRATRRWPTTWACPACGSVEYILTNPRLELPDAGSRSCGARLRGSQPPLRRGGVHGRPPLLRQLVDDGQLPLVAALRQLRGLLPRGQRPVGSGDHVALRLPDQRPDRSPRSAARSSATTATSATSARSARARCRSTGRTRSSCSAPTSSHRAVARRRHERCRRASR